MNTKVTLFKRLWYGLAICALVAMLVGTAVPAAAVSSMIVQASATPFAANAVKSCGGQITSTLDLIESIGADLSAAQQTCVSSQPGVIQISPNAGIQAVGLGGGEGDSNFKAPVTDYPDVTGADLVWKQGISGDNLSVAVVDTGISLHPGLILNGEHKNRIVGWMDFVNGIRLPYDPNGHGTHVAGIIANSQMGTDKEWNGIAPNVDLVGVRVLGENGSGTYEKVIQGIDWVVKNKAKYNIRVINLSLVAPAQSAYYADPLNRAVTAAWAKGIVVVTAAGNTGPAPMTIGVPGNNPYAITVGAFTDNYTPSNFNDDYLTPFSAAGPTLDGFAKPDVIAPGAHMVSTMYPWSYIAQNHDANKVNADYFSMAGTSQAAAVVSGIAALTISKHPELTPNQVKYRLTASALPWMTLEPPRSVYSIWQQGFGRVNAPDAVFANLEGEANLGMDIKADLAGKTHFQGYSYYDAASGLFRLRGDYAQMDGGYGTWNGQYTPGIGALGAWSGGLGAWSGALGAWSGGLGAWSGALGAWSGGLGAWSGGLGAWSGGLGAWSGGLGAWSGGYTTWAGGVSAWNGSEPWATLGVSEANFIKGFTSGAAISPASTISTCQWVEEP